MRDGKGTYQLNKLEPAVALVRRDRGIALDIGAHVGLWSMILARQFRTVHAFEPIPIHRACYEANLKNRFNVHMHPIALGSINGIVEVQVVPGNTGNTHINPIGAEPTKQAVTVQRLDDLAESLKLTVGVAFVKIDVEGYEFEVIKGAERTLRSNQPVMVVEQKGNFSERYGSYNQEAIKLLQSWGAHVMWDKNGDFCLKWRD